MARIRSIKPEFWTSEQVVECSTIARLMFIGMWNFVDDNGVMPANCRTLKMRVFPGDDDILSDNIRGMVDELLNVGLVAEYTIENITYWCITGWFRHQRIDKPNPKFPLPPADHVENGRLPFDDHSPPEGKGREGRRRGGESPPMVPPKGESDKSRRGSRLPSDWDLDDELRLWTKQNCPSINIESEVERFRDYWAGRPGAGGLKADWPATWRNWARKAVEFTKSRDGPGAPVNFSVGEESLETMRAKYGTGA